MSRPSAACAGAIWIGIESRPTKKQGTTRRMRVRLLLVSLRLIALESIAFEDVQSLRRPDEFKPLLRSLRMRGAANFSAGVDRRRVLIRGNFNMRDRVTDLFLEHGLGLPGHARLNPALHQKQRRLPVMDMGQDGAAVFHLVLINRLCEMFAAGLLQRGFDLTGDSLEFRIWHRQPDLGL